MLGALWALIVGTGYIGHQVQITNENAYSKEAAKQRAANGDSYANTWTDYHGREHDLKTGQEVYHRRDRNGDDWLYDIKGTPIRNITKQKREESFEKRKENALKTQEKKEGHVRAIIYEEWNSNYSPMKDIEGSAKKVHGTIYKDIDTGQKYILASINWDKNTFEPTNLNKNLKTAAFYLSLKSGRIVDVVDERFDKIDGIKEFIEFFNKEQDLGGWKKRALERDPYGSNLAKYCGKKAFYCQ